MIECDYQGQPLAVVVECDFLDSPTAVVAAWWRPGQGLDSEFEMALVVV